ncbi:MAG: hypothetical protein V3T53_09930 [Phycisphaerales bacterium]
MANGERWLGRAAAVAVAVLLCAAAVGVGGTALEEEIYRRLADHDDARAAELISQHLQSRPNDAVMLYNAACLQCRLREPERGASLLIDAVKAGFGDFSHMRRDPDLRPLHDHPIYQAILHARDAADPLLAQRQVETWRRRVGEAAYRIESDEPLRINYVTALDNAAQQTLSRSLHAQAELLGPMLFGDPPQHYVLIALLSVADAADHLRDPHAWGVNRHRRRELITVDTDRSLRHEFVHVLHHRHMDQLGQEHALWIQEGLAALFEDYEVSEDGSVVFLPNDRHNLTKRLARTGRLLSWPEVFALSKQNLRAEAARAYPQLRSLFRFMAERGRLEPWYHNYINVFDDDNSGVAALQRTFELPINEIERQWRQWLDRQPTIVTQAMVEKSVKPPAPDRPKATEAR